LRWPNYIQAAQLRGLSDHCAVILSVDEQNWGPRPFRMLKCWADVPGYKNFVSSKWRSFQVEGSKGYVMKEKFKMIKEALKEWHSNHTNNLPGKIAHVKDRIAVLDDRGVVASLGVEEVEELHRLTDDLHSLSRIHSSMCWQQSRLTWLREGDANTKYFHGTMSSRRRVNTISSIVVRGTVVEGVSNVRQVVYTHFSNHFRAPSVERPSTSDLNFRTLTYREGAAIIKPFPMEELKIAVWDCDSYKCPGLDGVNFGFIKEFWLDMREELMHYVSDFHRNGKLLKGINSTFITLIPKKDVPQSLNDFRPISLVGSLYKVLAKLLANRLKSVIGSVISDSQSAFVQGRQILDGILVASEVVDEAKKFKKDLLLLKVDFEKAYDSVDWKYLDDVMGKMAFPTMWRKWIRECVTTATASVLVNGSPTDEFSLARGLRQGDPLSPFLFLLAAEGFHVMKDSLNTNNLFSGYKVGTERPVSVSHLQFADDTLILGEKSWANVRAMCVVLHLFATMSGLKVNFHKSELVGINVPQSWLQEAADVLNCKIGRLPILYLGLPVGGDPRRLHFWNPVVNCIKSRLSRWKSKHLSFRGRLVLLKFVLTSLPVYALSFFKAPSGIIASIESLLIRFFWGGCEVNRKIAWIDWEAICLAKEVGGLGVRRLREFNLALLGKWCWRMVVDREGLWFRVLTARYGGVGGRFQSCSSHGSVWWKDIVYICDGSSSVLGSWFSDNLRLRVGTGVTILFWLDRWVSGCTPL